MEFWPSYDVIRRTCKDSREGILHSCNLVSISVLMFHIVHRSWRWPMRHHDSRSISSVDFRFVVIALSEYVAVFIPLWSSARNPCKANNDPNKHTWSMTPLSRSTPGHHINTICWGLCPSQDALIRNHSEWFRWPSHFPRPLLPFMDKTKRSLGATVTFNMIASDSPNNLADSSRPPAPKRRRERTANHAMDLDSYCPPFSCSRLAH